MKGPLKIVKTEAMSRTRKLNATWTHEIAQESTNYIDADAAAELAEMIEWSIQVEQLKAMSWLEFTVDRWDTSVWEEMHKWAKEHCNNEYKVRENNWLFKNEKDYIVFTLRWS